MASPEESPLPEWAAYKADPSQKTLGKILSIRDEGQQRATLAHMQDLFFETKNWRVAQHVALILAGVHVEGWPSDHAVAHYYALCASNLSGGDALTTLLLARLHWDRRLPGAVLYDLEQIDKIRGDSWPSLPFAAEYYTLRSMSYSYMGRLSDGLDTLLEGERSHGIPLPEAFDQLVLALTFDEPELESIAMRIAHLADGLNPRYQRLIGDAVKTRFLRLLMRGSHA